MRGATLGDAVKDRQVPCCTPGCTGTWTWTGAEQLKNWLQPGGREPPARMCDACFETKADLGDAEVPCTRDGCEGTWTWTRAEQIAARKKRQERPPNRLCGDCQQRRAAVQDSEVACRVKGCDRTFPWSREAQLRAGAPFAEPRPPDGMCDLHAKQVRRASDREVPCRTPGCDRTWTWMRWQQLEAASKVDDVSDLEPPQRYCEPCFARFRAATDVELPCRVKGCTNKWVWSKVAQVRAWKEAGENEVQAPERMCNRCSELLSKLEDLDLPCRIRSCKGTWRFTRGAQLELAVRGKKQPKRLCGACASSMAKLGDREEPCLNPGCTGTWTYSRAAQLIAQRRHGEGTPKAPKRTCKACDKFVKTHPPVDVPCIGCGQPVHWTSLAQLMVHLGQWAKATRCPSCISKGVPAPAIPPTSLAPPTPLSEPPDSAESEGVGLAQDPVVATPESAEDMDVTVGEREVSEENPSESLGNSPSDGEGERPD